MWRWSILLILAGVSAAQQAPAPTLSVDEQGQLPPEEDNAQQPKKYTFNPLQSNGEVRVGEFYFRNGDFRAAAGRFREATKWDDGNSQAWLRLAETEEKNLEFKTARESYEKYLHLAPNTKNTSGVRKKLEKLKAKTIPPTIPKS